MRLRVLYEDNHVLVAEKPAGVPSQADASGAEDMLGMVKAYVKEKYQKPGEVYIGLLHRLDRPAAGLMVLPGRARLRRGFRRKSARGACERGISPLCGLPGCRKKGAWKIIFTRTPGEPLPDCISRESGAKFAALEYEVLEARGAGRWRASNCSPGGRTRSACNFPPGLAAVGRCKIRQRRARPGAILLFSRVCAPDAQGADGVFPAAGHRSFCRIYLWNGKT